MRKTAVVTARRAALCALLSAALSTPTVGARADEELTAVELRQLYEALITPTVDTSRHLPAAGQQLTAEDLELRFDQGSFHPLVIEGGEVVGLVFVGEGTESGTLRFAPPDPVEQAQLVRHRGEAPWEAGISAGVLRGGARALAALLDDPDWVAGPGPGADNAPVLLERRLAPYRDPLLGEWDLRVEIDALRDRYDAAGDNGHLFAELRTAPGQWVSYHHNPRGSLLTGDSVSVFTRKAHGDSPAEGMAGDPFPRGDTTQAITVLASYPGADAPGPDADTRPFDLHRVALEVDITGSGLDADPEQLDVVATIQLIARRTGDRCVELALQDRRKAVRGDVMWPRFKVRAVRDGAAASLPAIQDRNRLVVVLPAPLADGEAVTLVVEYGGPLVESVGSGDQANRYFNLFNGYPWYPTSPHHDTHVFEATVRTPARFRAVASGLMTADDKQGNVRTVRFEEPAGIPRGWLTLGDFQLTTDHDGPVPIQVFATPFEQQLVGEAIENTRGLLEFYTALYGPYPFSVVTVLDIGGGSGSPYIGAPDDYLLDHRQSYRSSPALVSLPNASIWGLASGLAAQWWGQRCAPADYRSWWLVDGMRGYSVILAARTPESDAVVQRMVRDRHKFARYTEVVAPPLLAHRFGRDGTMVTGGRQVAALHTLASQLGIDRFVRTMAALIADAPDHGVSNDLFLEAAGHTLGSRQAQAFFDYWIAGTETPAATLSYAAVDVGDGVWALEGTLSFDGPPPPAPIPVVIPLGQDEQTHTITPTGPDTPFRIDGLPRKPGKPRLDPDHQVLLAARRVKKK